MYNAGAHPVRRPKLPLPIVPSPDEKFGLLTTYPEHPNLVKGSLSLVTEECLGGQ